MTRFSTVYLALLFAVLCVSTSAVWVKFSTAPAMIIALYRVVFTSLLIGGIKSKQLPGELKQLELKEYGFLLAAGICLALHFSLWITSLNHTSVSSSVLFTNLQVIFVLIFSILILKEKPGTIVIGGIIIALAGSSVIAQGDLSSGKLWGDIMALSSGFFVAGYFLIGRYMRAKVDALIYTFVVSTVAAIVLLLGSIGLRLPLWGYEWKQWGLFLLMAIGPGLGGHVILNWALKYLKAPVVAVSVLGESVGASILAFFIFKEHFLWYQIIGGLLILSGIYIVALSENRAVGNEG